jgi:hypothetical protein
VDLERYVKMLCKQVSFSIADLVGELGESSIAGTFERKEKVYLAFFLGPRGHSDFKSGGHLELQ